jgi:hypothetical protein
MKLRQLLTSATLLIVLVILCHHAAAQDLYTARGYWQEINKETYRKIKQKQRVGDPLNDNEMVYLQDYEIYLQNYYSRMSDAEKARYDQMKAEWDRELLLPQRKDERPEEFEWRGRDRAINFGYGFLYGLSVVSIAELDDAAAISIPLITGGLWNLGPAVNPKKYNDITRPVLRASNTGKFLGFIYGSSLGLALGGESDIGGKLAFGLGTVGSITLGEVAFHKQKQRNYSEGHIELMRHYGIVGPWLALSSAFAANIENNNLLGASLLAGGVGGLLFGNRESKKYAYTKGDFDNVSTFTWITTGLGFTAAIEAFENSDVNALVLIPALGTVAGTYFGQKAVKGVNLTKRQGSTIVYSSAGGALLGLGVVLLTEADSPTLYVGIPSATALIIQQILFNRYKNDNLANGFQSNHLRKSPFRFSMKVIPENYLMHQRASAGFTPAKANALAASPMVSLKLGF